MKYAIRQKKPLIFITSLVIAVFGIGAALALATSSVPSMRIPITNTTPMQKPNAAIAAELGILSRPATSADALPVGIEGSLNHWMPEQHSGANGRMARLARMSPQDQPIYLIPSTEGVCMLDLSGTENLCATAAEVEDGETTSAILCAPLSLPASEIEIGGILPDGAHGATVILSNGSRARLTIEGNVYVADFPRAGALPTEIEWHSADGRVHASDAHVPAGVATERCASGPA